MLRDTVNKQRHLANLIRFVSPTGEIAYSSDLIAPVPGNFLSFHFSNIDVIVKLSKS